MVVGSSITPTQKKDLTSAMRQFLITGKQGFVMSIVNGNCDRYMYDQADVSIGITDGVTNKSDIVINSDIHMTHLFGLTYLLLRHGNATHRRLKQVLKEFIYRSVLNFCIFMFFFITDGFSFILPFQDAFITAFVSIVSPMLYYFESIFYIDYGQGIFHRVFGEYLNTMSNDVKTSEVLLVMLSAFFDFGIMAIYIFSEYYFCTQTVDRHTGKPHTHEEFIVLCSLIFNILHLSRCRNVLQEVWVSTILELILFFLLTNTLLINQNTGRFYKNMLQLFSSNRVLFTVVFFILYTLLKRFILVVW